MEAVGDPACKRCAKQVAFGSGHTCVLLNDGSVECAGYNDDGAMALGPDGPRGLEQRLTLAPATALAGMPVSDLGAGFCYTCVLAPPSEGNKVYCMGNGHEAQFGNGRRRNSVVPVAVQGLRQSPRIIQLVVSYIRACVLYEAEAGSSASAMQCWGDRGVRPAIFDRRATDVNLTAVVTHVAVAQSTICGSRVDGSIQCWGAMTRDPTSTNVDPGRWSLSKDGNVVCGVVRPATSGRGDTKPVASLWCWGQYGADPLLSNNGREPWEVPLPPGDVSDVALGIWHGCALVRVAADTGGQVYCWGANFAGQLGQGYTSGTFGMHQGSATPLLVKGLRNVTALYAGEYATCAASADQQVMCWGDNLGGKLGVGFKQWEEDERAVTSPTSMPGLCA